MTIVSTRRTKNHLLNNWLLLFLLAMILANIGGNMYGSLLPLYLQDLKANMAQVGLFFTLSQIFPLIFQILGGWISDSLGRLRSISIGSLAGIVAYITMIAVSSWQWVLLAMVFMSITNSLIGPSFDAFISEQSSEENRARVFGVTQALFMIVTVVGPPMGGWLVSSYGFKFMLLIAGIFYLLAALIRIGMARKAAHHQEADPQKLSLAGLKINLSTMLGLIISGGVITWVLFSDGIRDVAFALSLNLMPIYMKENIGLTIQQIGLSNGVFGLFTMLLAIPAGRLADRKGERVNIALGFLFLFLALMVIVQIPHPTVWAVMSGWAFAGTGVGLMTPAYQSLISKVVPPKVRGTAFGLFSTSLGLISLPAPALGAMLWERFDPRLPFAITAWSCLFMVPPVWLKFRLPQKSKNLLGLNKSFGEIETDE